MIFDDDDTMEAHFNEVAVKCVKCNQHGERSNSFCGPGQRYDDGWWENPLGPGKASAYIRLFGWSLRHDKSEHTRYCQIAGEHFHLSCQHCRYRWTEPIRKEENDG